MIGILIIFYSDMDHIPVLSGAINNQTYKGYRVYCLDNNITVKHIECLKDKMPGVIYLENQDNNGFACGNNILATRALDDGCEYLWVLNPDMEPEPEALETLIRYIDSDPKVGMVGPLLLKGGTKDRPRIQLFGSNASYRTQKKQELFADKYIDEITLPAKLDVDLINAGSLLIRSDFIKNSYLFEERYFMYNDEIDLARRVREAGYKIVVLSDAKVWHHHDWSSGNKAGFNLMYYYMMRNKLLYYYKYNMKMRVLWEFIKQLILSPAVLRFCLKTSGFTLFGFYYLGLFHGLLNRQGKAGENFDSV